MATIVKPAGTLGLILAVAVGSAAAHICTSAMPLQVGSLIDGYTMSASSAGLFGFFQIASLAVCMIVFSRFAHVFRPLSVCLLGTAVAIAANGLIYVAPPVLAVLAALGSVSGIGYGLILSSAVAGAADVDNPDRVYAAGNAGSLLLIVGLLALLPFANSYFGPRGTFIGIALLLIIMTPLLLGFRGHQARIRHDKPPQIPLPVVLSLLAMWCLFSFGTGAMWTFAERIGHALDLSGPTIGLVLSSSAFVGLLGTGLAAWQRGRIPRPTALAIGLIGGGGSCLLLANAINLPIYAAAAMLYWIFTMYLYVLLLSTAAEIDPTGRLGTLGTGCERLSFAFGAPIGGVLVDLGSFFWIGVIAAVACAIAAPLCLPALSRALRKKDLSSLEARLG